VHNIEGYAEECYVQTTSRRSVLLGGASAAALAVGFPLRSFAQESITVDQFRALSARLTGAGMTDLDPTAAGKLLDGFISMGRGPDLAVLAADPGVSAGALADDIVAARYSGLYNTRSGLATLDLTKALLWDALDFTKPPGLCGGATGYWADAPHS
jgi:hypothetical protein